MGFLDDIFRPLNKLFETKDNIWTGLEKATVGGNLSQSGVSNLIEDAPPELDSARKIPTADIAGLIQQRPKAFSVYDVTPYNLNQQTFGCRIPANVLASKVGWEGEGYADATNSFNSWRTIEFPTPGTNFKFEWLPGQINFPLVYSGGGTNPQDFGKEDLSDITQMPTPNAFTVGFAGEPIISSRVVLVQFDDPTSTPIIIKAGDTVNIPFFTVFITFKTLTPRFNVMLGYNTTIKSTGDDRQMQSQLATGPGFGMWDNPSRHCMPFCFTNRNNQNGAGAGYSQITDAGDATHTLFNLANISPLPIGVATGWITSFTFAASDGSSGTTSFFSDMVAQIWIQGATSAKTKLLAQINLHWTNSRNGAFAGTNWFERNMHSVTKNFDTPIRFTLTQHSPATTAATPSANLQQLIVYVKSNMSPASGITNYTFTIEGYTFGGIQTKNRVTPLTSQYGVDLLNVAPFPIDLKYTQDNI